MDNRKEWLFLLFSTVVIIAFSCVDKFDFQLDGTEEFLVIDGQFTPGGGDQQIKLFYASATNINRLRKVSGASITLVENNEERVTYEEIAAGVYQVTEDQILGKVGNQYHIEITLEDNSQYRSNPSIMPPLIKGDSLHFDYSIKQIQTGVSVNPRFFIDVSVYSPLPVDREEYWLKWEVNSLYSFPEMCGILLPGRICYIPGISSPQQVLLLEGSSFAANYLENWMVTEKMLTNEDFEFRGRHYFLVNQRSITREAFEYWEKIDLIANQSGSIFDAPPAAVPGNIYNVNDEREIVLGFFELTSIDILRQFVTGGSFSDFFKFPINICPTLENPFVGFPDPACCNCQLIRNATLERPPWF